MKTNELKRYDAYKPSGVEWLGEIPAHWEIFRIKNITEYFSRGASPDYVENSNHKVVNQATFSKGYFDSENTKFTSEKSVLNTNFVKAKVQKNDILLASTGGGVLGKVCHFQLDADNYYADSHVTIIRSYSYELSKYIYYLLSVNYALINGILSQGSTNQTELQKHWLGNFLISLPPFSEQIAITQFLDTKTALIDKAIAVKEKQITLLKERLQAIINQTVTKGLNPDVPMKESGIEWIREIPAHWGVKKLKYIAKVISEKVLSKDSDLPYLGMENVESWTGKYLTTNSEVEGLANCFSTGDILFGKLRPYLAKVFLAEENGICSSEFLVYRCQPAVLNIFLQKVFLSYDFISRVDSSTYGSKMPRANADFINNQFIIIPPIQEQSQILTYIQNISRGIEINSSLKQQEIEKLKEYKASLINSAVTGKIKVF